MKTIKLLALLLMLPSLGCARNFVTLSKIRLGGTVKTVRCVLPKCQGEVSRQRTPVGCYGRQDILVKYYKITGYYQDEPHVTRIYHPVPEVIGTLSACR